MSSTKTISAVLIGLLLLVGAAAGWKFWDIHPFLAFLVGASGVSLIGAAFGRNLL